MIELWELSDGRIWQITHLPLGRVMVSSLLDDNQLSVIGEFDNETKVVLFAEFYLHLIVKTKVREN